MRYKLDAVYSHIPRFTDAAPVSRSLFPLIHDAVHFFKIHADENEMLYN